MGIRITTVNNEPQYNLKEFIADTAADIPNLPTKNVAPGSQCLVADNPAKVLVFNTNKEWVEL